MAIDIQILKRFFEGKYSRKDYLAIIEKLGNENDEREIGEQMLSHWNEFEGIGFTDENIDHILDKLQHQIRLEESRKVKKHSFYIIFQKIAAILIVPIILAFLAYMNFKPRQTDLSESYAEIQCPLGVRTKFVLPDGTKGFLNSGSILKYPVVFNKSREVNLTGEAFFEVNHNQEMPFIVHTQNLNIKDLGTSFNVISWPGEKTEEVILQTGMAEIITTGGSKICDLLPDEKVVLNTENGKSVKSKVIALQYTGWKDGKLVFRNEDMIEVAKRLSRWYNAEIVVADNRLADYRFHATFQDEQLDEVLKLLALTTPIKYTEEKRNMANDGLVPKRKIVLIVNPYKVSQF